MNTRLIAASLLTLAAAGSAFAGSSDFDLQNRTPFQGSLSREQVRAEVIAANRDGSLSQINGEAATYAPAKAVASTRSRAEVRAEAVQAARTVTHQEMM